MITPKTVKLGTHKYKVKLVKESDFFYADKIGLTDKTKGIIFINKNLIQTEKDSTLWHEILHVINGELSEVIVDSLSQQIVGVLKDNNLCYNKKHETKVRQRNTKSTQRPFTG